MHFRYVQVGKSVYSRLDDTRGLRRRPKTCGTSWSSTKMILLKYGRSRRPLNKDIASQIIIGVMRGYKKCSKMVVFEGNERDRNKIKGF